MFDNGLLKYYFNNSKEGYLNASSIGINRNVTNAWRRVQKTSIGGKSFYLKSTTSKPEISKQCTDAEVLLSQIYYKAGIDTAIYLPATNKYGNFLISNDISSSTVVPASSYLYPYLSEVDEDCFPFLSEDDLKLDPNNVFNNSTMQEQTKMRILDTASFNPDRHYLNFFYKFQKPFIEDDQISRIKWASKEDIMDFFRSFLPNKPVGVVAIDYSNSGNVLYQHTMGNTLIDYTSFYESDFKPEPMIRDDLINQIRTSQPLEQLIDKQALAEEIGSLNPSAVAEDIKQTIDYTVDPKVVDVLTKSYDDMAETLMQ